MISPRTALLLALTAIGLVCLSAGRSQLLSEIELKTLDWRAVAFAPKPNPQSGVVLLMLDQQSLDQFEKDDVFWPWPRSIYEAVLSFCKAGGARAVAFDMLFTSPSPYGRVEDETLAKALKKAGPVVLAMEMGSRPQTQQVPERFSLETTGELSAAPRQSARPPIKVLLDSAPALGDAAASPDQDGVFRRVPLLSSFGGRLYPTMTAAAVLAVSRDKTVAGEVDGLRLGDYKVPLTDGNLLIRFHGPSAFPSYPLGRVIQSWQNIQEHQEPSLKPEALQGKLVLIGYSAPGLKDLRPTPVSPKSPGTEVLAAAAANILEGDFLRKAPANLTRALVLLALLAGFASALFIPHVLAPIFSLVLAAAAVLAFRRAIWLDMVAPQLSLWLAFAASSAYGYAVEGRKKKEIQKAFSHYLAPEVVAEIAEDPEKLKLGGERRELTCYFSDIEGFTTISESLQPDRLTYLMNRYLGEMTDTVLESKGTLDKYIGDAIMAFWGAPVARPDHALTACKVALDNQAKLKVLSKALEAEGFPPIRTRIGLNSGTASVGNMGSSKRFSYTALGDDINLASRLEGANKNYGTYLMISETTKSGAGAAVETRELDLVKVKGKAKAVKVYELLGLAGTVDSAVLARARRFEDALALLRSRKFEEALKAFDALLPDKAAKLYIERCRLFMKEAPAEGWEGSFALTEK